MSAAAHTISREEPNKTLPSAAGRDFFNPIADFLCLGGGSILLVIFIALSGIARESTAYVAAVSMTIAHLVNHPHFAHSYQLFYSNYLSKALHTQNSSTLRLRYLFAGIVAPTALIAFFTIAVLNGQSVLLGRAATLMGLLVGWHYVKQGYGILIACSVLKRQFFSTAEKHILLANAYSCWITFWLAINWRATLGSLWGIEHFMFPVPDWMLFAALCVSAGTTSLLAVMLLRKWKVAGRLPVNGVVAYLSTLYLWLTLLLHPVFALVIPACHSLQYLVVVWRYRLNFESQLQSPTRTASARLYSESRTFRFSVFILSGSILGYFGFWALPEFLDSVIAYDRQEFGSTLFLFIFWVFINVHHYLIDNVIWRRENPDTKLHLFGL